MTHADYVAQGYPERYQVTDVYEETNGVYAVDVFDNLKFGNKQIAHHTFSRLEQAEKFYHELMAGVDDWEVEVNEDDPIAEYQDRAMAELKGGA